MTMYSVFKEVCIPGRHMGQSLTLEIVKSCFSVCISYDSETYLDNQCVPVTTEAYMPMYLCVFLSAGACVNKSIWRPKIKIQSLP